VILPVVELDHRLHTRIPVSIADGGSVPQFNRGDRGLRLQPNKPELRDASRHLGDRSWLGETSGDCRKLTHPAKASGESGADPMGSGTRCLSSAHAATLLGP